MSWFDYSLELSKLISNTPGTPGQGYWVVLRMSRLGQYSQAWDEDRQEVKEGSKYEYDDMLVRCISSIAGALNMRSALTQSFAQIYEAGKEDTSSHIFAIEMASLARNEAWDSIHHRRLPTQQDTLFEISECEGAERPHPPLTAESRYSIIDHIPVRGDNGKVEVLLILGRRDHSK